MWLRRSRAGKVRSRLPVCRWIDAGFCASAHTQDVRSSTDLTAPKFDFRSSPRATFQPEESNFAPDGGEGWIFYASVCGNTGSDDEPGQNRKSSMRAHVFRCSPNNGHCQDTSVCPLRADFVAEVR